MSKEAFKQIVSESPDIQQAVTSHAQNDMANIRGAGQEAQDTKGLFSQVAGAVVDTVGAAYDLAQKPGMQGAAELASALFNGSAYVAYGEGQQSNDVPQHGLPEAAKQQEMERGGMER